MANICIAKRIGNRIRKKRIELGLSQEALGEMCDLHRTYIGVLERGEKNVTVMTLMKIANALNEPVSFFIES
ncbi:helix-turn-helix transcriptional regulator [Desulfobacterales bacterium HSG2]|nr:helix-turn-helix transcriptional regulator [Desulfobacterales bacterium HSG2]